MKNPRRLKLPPLLPDLAIRVYEPPEEQGIRVIRGRDKLRGWERDSTPILYESHPDHWARWAPVLAARDRLLSLQHGTLPRVHVLELYDSISPELTQGPPRLRIQAYHHGLLLFDGVMSAVVDMTIGHRIRIEDHEMRDLGEYATFLETRWPAFGSTRLGRAALADRVRISEMMLPGYRRGKPKRSALGA